MGFESGLLEAVVADTLVRPHHVFADAVRTDSTGARTLVDVFAGLLVRTQFVSRWTQTFEAALGVQTSATAAKTGSFFAFVYIWFDGRRNKYSLFYNNVVKMKSQILEQLQ